MAVMQRPAKQAVQYELFVDAAGRLEIPSLGLPAGTPVEVIVLVSDQSREQNEELSHLQAASDTSIGFWNNPIDDETWNDF